MNPAITNPTQRRLLEALDVLAALHCEARDAEYTDLATAALAAERHLTVFQTYAEGTEGAALGIGDGEPLPWRVNQ